MRPRDARSWGAHAAVVKPALDSTSQRANLSKSFFVLQPVPLMDRAAHAEPMLGTRARLLYRSFAVAFAQFHDE
jgi:hypothetical protein